MTKLVFAYPEAFYLLLGLIPMVLLFWYFISSRGRALHRFGESDLVARLVPARPSYKHQVKFGLVCLAYISLVIALANPRMGRSMQTMTRSGIDLMIALDVSNSMLSMDQSAGQQISPRTPTRLDKAKRLIQGLIDELAGDRVGLIIFAGQAFVQVPITYDYALAKTLLGGVKPDMVSRQGTAIGDAIDIALKSFSAEKTQHKAILIISDGENHQGTALEIAEKAREAGVTIFTVGVGSTSGAPIPVFMGDRFVGNKKDGNQSIVVTKMNPEMLQQIAQTGNGSYLFLEGDAVRQVSQAIDQLEEQEYEAQVFEDYEDQFQWFVILAILFLSVEYILSESKSKWFSDWSIFKSES